MQCTFYENASPGGGGIEFCLSLGTTIERCLVTHSTQGVAIAGAGYGVTLTCCDLFGNAGGDWVGGIENQYGIDGNICEDPLFCDPENGDYHLQEGSPCAPFTPPNEECDLIGAWPVGCGGTPVQRTTWGSLKATFR